MREQQILGIIFVSAIGKNTIGKRRIHMNAIDIRKVALLPQYLLNEEHSVGDTVTISRSRVELMDGPGLQVRYPS